MKRRDEQHYRDMIQRNRSASVGFTLAASAVYAARHGLCEAEHHHIPKWRELARRLKRTYGENLTVDQVLAEMDNQSDNEEKT